MGPILVRNNAFEERIYSPQLHTILCHCAAQFVICSQISVTSDDRIDPAIYGCRQNRVILGITTLRWHGDEFHPIAPKAQLFQESLRIVSINPISMPRTPPDSVQFLHQRFAHDDGESARVPRF
jgi:hypothetical protein